MQKTKKFRRLLAGLLAVLMLSICIPAMAFAEGETNEATLGFFPREKTITVERVVDNSDDSLESITLKVGNEKNMRMYFLLMRVPSPIMASILW